MRNSSSYRLWPWRDLAPAAEARIASSTNGLVRARSRTVARSGRRMHGQQRSMERNESSSDSAEDMLKQGRAACMEVDEAADGLEAASEAMLLLPPWKW